MFDAAARKIIDPPLNSLGRFLTRHGVSANMVTLAGYVPACLVLIILYYEIYYVALFCIVLNRFLDGLDGAVARQSHVSDLGGFLDIVGDFIFYSAVPFGFALARPEDNALASAFLIFSFIGTGSSFLSYAIVAAKRGLTTQIQGRKSFYYLGGLTEGTETIVFFILCCFFPDYFAVLAWGFGALCWVTTMTRMVAAWHAFRD
jgi:phosphatidylglycerophosphate synthase